MLPRRTRAQARPRVLNQDIYSDATSMFLQLNRKCRLEDLPRLTVLSADGLTGLTSHCFSGLSSPDKALHLLPVAGSDVD